VRLCVPCRNSPQQLVDDDIDGIAEEGNSSLAGSVPSGGVGTAGGRVSVGTVHFCLGFYYVCRPVREAVVDKVNTFPPPRSAGEWQVFSGAAGACCWMLLAGPFGLVVGPVTHDDVMETKFLSRAGGQFLAPRRSPLSPRRPLARPLGLSASMSLLVPVPVADFCLVSTRALILQ
jgi:hypothetical protein